MSVEIPAMAEPLSEALMAACVSGDVAAASLALAASPELSSASLIAHSASAAKNGHHAISQLLLYQKKLPKCIFYPSRASAYTVALQGLSSTSTHDTFASGGDERHYIDLALLRALPDGAERLAALATDGFPMPLIGQGMARTLKPTAKPQGAAQGQGADAALAAAEGGSAAAEGGLAAMQMFLQRHSPRLDDYVAVLGVLSSPLEVTLQRGGEALCALTLTNVHVVDALPVPLHISLMQLQARGNLPAGVDWLGLDHVSAGQQPEVTRDSFPAAYHGRAFWAPSTSTFIAGLP